MSYDSTDEELATARGLDTEMLEQIQMTFTISNRKIGSLSDSQFVRLMQKLTLRDQPQLRADFQVLIDRGGEDEIDMGSKYRALDQLQKVRESIPEGPVAGVPAGQVQSPQNLSPPPLLSLAGLAPTGAGWTSLGPGNVGGRTRTIVIDPQDPDRIWAGSVGGGVWLTTNGGANWHPVDDRMANLAVTSVVMDPNNSKVMYAGTGEGFYNGDAIRGAGIFKTINGASWDLLGNTDTADFQWIQRLAISADGSTLLAATRSGIMRSTDNDHAVWAQVENGDFADVKFHPTDSNLAIAGGSGRTGGAMFSTDGGQTWTAGTGIPGNGRVEMAYATANPGTVYASVDTARGQIFRSTDGGATFAARASNNQNGAPAQYLGQQGWYDNTIWAGDNDVNLVVVGGIDLWRSTDGGDTLSRMSNWMESASAHADHHYIVSHPGYDSVGNTTVFFGNDGGIYRADDVRTVGNDANQVAGWASLVNGYAVTQHYGVAGNAASGTIIGGCQDNGTVSFTPVRGVDDWVEILGGDGGYCAADQTDPNFFYEEYVFLEIHRNDNGAIDDSDWWQKYISGKFFNAATRRWDTKPVPFNIPDVINQDALFIAPFVLDPNNSDRLLGGGAELWRTNDAKTPNTDADGPHWGSIKPRTVPAPQSDPISAVTVAAGDSDIVWVGHVSGQVFACNDATSAVPSWTEVGVNGPLPSRMCTRLAIDPTNHDVVYATFARYSDHNVWRTDNAGGNWQDLSVGLPEAPVRCIAIHPRRPTYLYLGTELGIFTSEDQGATWSPTNEGPTNCPVTDLVWMNETLVCATHGRGMFSIDLSGVPDP